MVSLVNLTKYREGNTELPVVAAATWVLVHVTKLQPIHRLLRPGAGFGRRGAFSADWSDWRP